MGAMLISLHPDVCPRGVSYPAGAIYTIPSGQYEQDQAAALVRMMTDPVFYDGRENHVVTEYVRRTAPYLAGKLRAFCPDATGVVLPEGVRDEMRSYLVAALHAARLKAYQRDWRVTRQHPQRQETSTPRHSRRTAAARELLNAAMH